ncbi:MAG: GUN4 domain-containing protein [Cyanobacteria bacterium P01_G01_bin.39]
MTLIESESNRFKVALSFPGEHRDFVLKVAEELATRLTRDRVFYDEWYEIELLGVGGDLKLQSMYEQADLVVPFFSEHYSKSWCSLEWETIRGILLDRRKEDTVIPVHLDDTDIPGWSVVNFGIRLRGRTPQKISELIIKILAQRNLLNISQQEKIEELNQKLKDLKRSHSSQLAAIKATSRQEKEELEQSYQSQISQLKQQLEREKLRFNQQQADLQAAQAKIAEQEAIITQLEEQIDPLTKTTAQNEVELNSAKGIDYKKLRDLLAAEEWKKADEETTDVMLEVAERKSEGCLRKEDINNFPCEDLRTINQLWLHYSDGKFGFSVQMKIYESLGGTKEYDEKVWLDYGDLIGWRQLGNYLNYEGLTWIINQAPRGHLPCQGIGIMEWYFCYLFSRANTCNL